MLLLHLPLGKNFHSVHAPLGFLVTLVLVCHMLCELGMVLF